MDISNLFKGRQIQRTREILELFRAPQYTEDERDALKSPKEGQIILNKTTHKLNSYLNGVWVEL
jgi:hypothetical protein